ncbi:pyruvate dehydrogenase kinase [Reticulomyxa filosa]|uniref:Protein-serine/threonine kinase n=1 Tax=Reticulomyxa filosa TaxID=46433 RepID=X6MHV5_RETFI|nr:pyruvate dehydrogenase kinase [Reticulomyxa filosa]|eukprot:ETO13007.1 pyruvate dehydrogenase kinase [Reticulomyxa filosa]
MAEENPMFKIEETPYLNDFIDRICQLRNGIYQDTNVVAHVEEAIADASVQCQKYFGEVPKVNIHDKRKQKHFIYIPEHLHHISFELLKNSMRAVCETHPKNLKPIDIIIVDTPETVTIKIADKGGGIPRADMEKIWLYSYTTAVDPYGRTRKELFALLQKEAQSAPNREMLVALKNIPMFGLGYGLSLARLYARYYGGDCNIFSVHGYGTDTYVYLNDLSKSNAAIIG